MRQLNAFSDPDVQMSVADAQHTYARSGSAEIGRALIDLVLVRCSAASGSLEANVINDAIQLVGKMSTNAISALTVNFLISQVVEPTITDRQSFIEWIETNVQPFLATVSTTPAEYEYLVTLGCVERRGFLTSVPYAPIESTYRGVFQTGCRYMP